MAETGALVGGTPARGGLFAGPSERTERSRLFREDRFLTRARALFYARLAFLVLGLGVIGVPSWSAAFGVGGPKAFAVYLVMVAYSAANYVFLARKTVGKALTFATLCADLCVLVWLVSVDRKSTRLNSSHVAISYAVFCLKKKTRTCMRRTPGENSVFSISSSTSTGNWPTPHCAHKK